MTIAAVIFPLLLLILSGTEVPAKLLPISNKNIWNNISHFLETSLKDSLVNVLVSEGPNDLPTMSSAVPLLSTTSANWNGVLEPLNLISRNFIILNLSLASINATLNENLEFLPGSAKYFIVTDNHSIVADIAEAFWKARLLHSFIVVYNESSDTIGLFKLNVLECGARAEALYYSDLTEPISPADLGEANLMAQFIGRPLYVSWTTMAPFVEPSNTTVASGIYVDLLKALSHFSRRPLILRPFEPIYGDEISQSYSFESVLNDLDGEYSQIFLGPTNTHTIAIFDLSPIILENTMMFLCPKPLTVFWHKIVSRQMALPLIGYNVFVIFIAALFTYMAKATVDRIVYTSVGTTCFLFFGINLDVPSLNKRLPKSSNMRILLVAVLLQAMVISIFMQGSVVSELSASIYGKPIETKDDLIYSQLPIKCLNGLSYLFQFSSNPIDKEVHKRMETVEGVKYLYEAGDLVVEKKDFATIVDTGYLIMRPNILRSFSIFEVYNVKQAIAMPKGAYYSNQFNEWFRRLIEIGIVSKCVAWYRYYYALTNSIKEEKREFVVTLEQFLPSVVVTVTLYVFSTAIFVIEVSVQKFQSYIRQHRSY